MNYLNIYNQLVFRSISRQLTEYSEKHHIIPKCMNGTNKSNNIVKLTAREHFLAHLLLVRIYPENIKLKFALKSMCTLQNKYHNGQRITNRLFGEFRELSKSLHTGMKRSEETKRRISESNMGKHSHSPETRKKLSENHKGQIPWHKGKKMTDELKQKLSNSHKGIRPSLETCQKLSDAKRGRKRVYNLDGSWNMIKVEE